MMRTHDVSIMISIVLDFHLTKRAMAHNFCGSFPKVDFPTIVLSPATLPGAATKIGSTPRNSFPVHRSLPASPGRDRWTGKEFPPTARVGSPRTS